MVRLDLVGFGAARLATSGVPGGVMLDVRPVLLATLLALLAGTLAQPSVAGRWHGPDSHSSLPHRAPGLSSLVESAMSAEIVPAGGIGWRARVASWSGLRPDQAEAEPPEPPPR